MSEIEKLGSYISHLEAHRDSLIARNEVLEAALREAKSCIDDLGSGRGGWAWEEVISQIDAALAPEQDK